MDKPKLLLFTLMVIIGSIAVGCSQDSGHPERQKLTIFAASSLSDVMDALAAGFQATHPEVEVLRHYASSSQLAAQLIEGAPADVYASANKIQMGYVVEAGITGSQPVIFATNRLTICVPLGNPGEIHSTQDIGKADISLIIAAPQTPIRNYTDLLIQQLGNTEVQAAVYRNVVSEEVNVRQVVAKIALGEADAGVVYTSDLTADVRDRLEQVEIPRELNLTAEYPIAVIADSHIAEIAQEFVEYVLSDAGQSLLAEWGFGQALSSEE